MSRYKQNMLLANKIAKKIKHFAIYQYVEGKEFNEGYDEDKGYNEIEKIAFSGFSQVYDVVQEMLHSYQKDIELIEDEEKEVVDNIFSLLKDYLSCTNFIIDQKNSGVEIKYLDFITLREVAIFSQSYATFNSIFFKEYCYDYFNSGFISKKFERILVYDLSCCEYSSYLDETTISFSVRWSTRNKKKKYPPALLLCFYYIKIIIMKLINFALFYYFLSTYLFDNKDIAMLCAITFSFLNIKEVDHRKQKIVEGFHILYHYLRESGFVIKSKHILRILNTSIQKDLCYPGIMFEILDRAEENKYW